MTSAEFDGRRQEMEAALADGKARLAELRLSRLGRYSAEVALKLFQGRDPENALDSVQSLRVELGQIQTVLAEIYNRGLAAEHQEAARNPFGDAWTTVARRRLAGITDAEAWRDEWLATWSEALAALRFETADAIAKIDNTHADVADLRPRLLSVTHDLESADWQSAVAGVDGVLGLGIARTASDTRLRVLTCRILRRRLDNLDAAETAAIEAMGRTAHADAEFHDLAVAAVAEIRFDREEWDGVRELTDDALDRDVGAADLLIVAGRLAEAQARYSDARDCYDAVALRFGPPAGAGALYVETPGTLLWRLARQIRWLDGFGALDLIDRALVEGVTGKGADPERRVILDRARILDQLEQRTEAARAYHEAGERYAWTGSDRALDLFERAVHLDEDNPLFRWSLGESLRQRATAREWAIDRDRLQRAKVELDKGFALAPPAAHDAWAFASLALVDEALDIPGDPALLFERALLRSPGYARAYALLAVVLRLHGYYAEAMTIAAAGYWRDPDDAYIAMIHTYSLLDMGDMDTAQQVVDESRRHNGFDLELSVAQANIHLRRRKPAAALESLEEADDEPGTRFERAVCHAALGNLDEERKLYELILADADDTTHPSLRAWADYRLGSPDLAIEELSLIDELPGRPVTTSGMDLAQMLLLRESADDVEAGRELLLSSIEASRTIGNLSHLASYELPLLIETVAGTPREAAVRHACAEATGACDRRIEALRNRRRPDDRPSVRLALARMAMTEHDHRRAAALYVPFCQDGDPPEVTDRLSELAERLMSDGDALLSAGDLAAAQEVWEWLRDKVVALLGDHLGDGVRTRLALCDVDAARPGAASTAAQLRRTDEGSLSEVVRKFTRDVPSLWTHVDGLGEVFADEPTSSPVADVTRRRGLYSKVYALGRDAVPEFAMSPFVSAIEVVLGGGLAHLTASSEIERRIRAQCDRMTDEMGVLVPGIGVRVQHDLGPHAASFQVYGRTMATVTLPGDQPDDLTPVLSRLEDVLRDNLFRWISVEDLELWNAGWDASSYHADGDQSWLPQDPEGRLRLARLLRLLVREGVPIRDRETIGQSFAATATTDPYELLTAARRRLYPWILGTAGGEPAEPAPLPGDLEARVADGLDGDGSTWAMSRAGAIGLIDDLRAWRTSALPDVQVAIRTASLAIRPYVWRLLAAERPRVFVVAREELP
ncbi:MAG: hypothetical protein WBA97_06565 [Actinophytocola sp.]|uniref:hypothetical protein n=1 Tax=Actinophytocola sp. TaxID=1872138 RepID=UPI003C713978